MSSPAGAPSPDRSIGQLVADATKDLQLVLRGEIELAKAEIGQDVKEGGQGFGLLAGAGVLGLYAFGLILLGLAWVLATWLPVWAGLLIVAGVLLLVAGVLALLGRRHLQAMEKKPRRTIRHAQDTAETLKRAPRLMKGETAA